MPLLKVIVNRGTDDLDSEDLGVEGGYGIYVDDALPCTSWPSAALDCFHESVPIACLDDFNITVCDGQGQSVAEDGSQLPYTLGAFGQFLGVIGSQGDVAETV